ncbi:MAG: LarC family nickel insertion protein [Chloroflexota bacterium]|nr:LarC family nickel insertion protein [Chloroflexota bacterium]
MRVATDRETAEGETIGYFDAARGAAGDMILAALLDAGLAFPQLKHELGKMNLPPYELVVERVDRGIRALRFMVRTPSSGVHHHGPLVPGEGWTARDLDEKVTQSTLSEPVQTLSLRILRRLAAAEAAAAAIPLAEVQYDELSAIDTLVDAVGASIGIAALGLSHIYCSPLPAGRFTIDTRHGSQAIPSPRTRWLLESSGVPTTDVPAQVTATGAAILTTVAGFTEPAMRLERIGYGAGEAETTEPNVLRLLVGRQVKAKR